MSLDAVKHAIAAFLLHLLTTLKEGLPEDELLAEVKKEGHRPSDVKAALYEMKRDGLVHTDKHTEYYKSDSPMDNVPDGVFFTGYQNPEPLKIEWVVIRPSQLLADWWEIHRDASRGSAIEASGYGRESPGPLRVVEIPLGGPENKDLSADEERADAGRAQGGAGQGEGTGKGKRAGGRKPLEESAPLKFQVYQRIQKEHQPGKHYADAIERLKRDKDFVEQVQKIGQKLNGNLVRAALAYFAQPKPPGAQETRN